ncbi:hypothetical protein FB561_6189 [Kribbella amoyensis]|uniref:Uncharacterized protein n=1 Tax=Kribbella amoyensis TaxID=996641 RepID=A0A561B7M8_9ACTN|nr:hypothetical protein [Kribbella amoyensis]TWD74758.1 hypothetical protein FB561_6189 [Kribbella amoyensis]
MTRLYLATLDGQKVWVTALIDEDVWTYVANTGQFHLNRELRDEFFTGAELEFTEIGPRTARQHVDEGVGRLDDDKVTQTLRAWDADAETLSPETVFAAAVADHT